MPSLEFPQEEDAQFVYLALERCKHSLKDVMDDSETRSLFLTPAGQPSEYALQVLNLSPMYLNDAFTHLNTFCSRNQLSLLASLS